MFVERLLTQQVRGPFSCCLPLHRAHNLVILALTKPASDETEILRGEETIDHYDRLLDHYEERKQ